MAPKNTTAAASKATPAPLAFEAVTPAPRKGREGSIAFPKGTVDALAEFIKDGAYAGDGQTYDTRQKANTRVTRLKRALIHYGHYNGPKEIKSRVWEVEGGKFRLALTNAAAAEAAAKAAKASG